MTARKMNPKIHAGELPARSAGNVIFRSNTGKSTSKASLNKRAKRANIWD